MVAIKQTGTDIIKITTGAASSEIVEKLTKIHNENFEEKKNGTYFLEILNNDLYSVFSLSEEETSEISGYAVFYDTFDSVDLLEVNENNEKAIKLYKKNGFEEISVRKNYYGNHQNALIMFKNS